MNEDFDIGNYKPEELQLRDGAEVVTIFHNDIVDNPHLEFCKYSVIYKIEGVHYLTSVKNDGRAYEDCGSKYDVILKFKFDLIDYINNPSMLITNTNDDVLSVISHPYNYEIYVVTIYNKDCEICEVFECYRDGKFKNKVGCVTLKTHVKPVEKISELPELYNLFKKYIKVMDDEGIDLRLYNDEECELYDSDNDKICGFYSFKEMIEFLKEKLK